MQKQFMNKQSMQKQKGMTFISWVIIIAIIGFHFMIGIRVMPILADAHTIEKVWKDLGTDTSLVGANPKKIRQAITRKLRVNNVTLLKSENIEVKKSSGEYIVTARYEPRGKIVGNMDFIMTFTHEAKIRAK